MRSFLYFLARILGDAEAVKKDRIKKRIGRRMAGRVTGKFLKKLFK